MITEIKQKYNDHDSITEDGNVSSLCIFDLRHDSLPQYTIAIPTYLRPDLLSYALSSCLNQQTSIPFDLLVVDNNPERNDSTEQLMLAKYKKSGIAYFKNTQNIGMSGNWNKLYLLARTQWVVMLHDDDMLYPDFLTIMNKCIESAPHSVCFYSCYNYIKGESFEQPNRENKPIKLISLKEKDYLTGCHVHAPLGMTIKRQVVFDVGGFNREFYPSLDYHFHVKLAHYFPVLWLRNYPIATYRWLTNASNKEETLTGWIEKDNIIKWLIWKNNKMLLPNWLYEVYLRFANYKFQDNWYKKFKGQSFPSKPFVGIHIIYLLMKLFLGLPKHFRRSTTIVS